MASPYLALMQSGALRRNMNVPMFGGPMAAGPVNPITDPMAGAPEALNRPSYTPPQRMMPPMRGIFSRPRPPVSGGAAGGSVPEFSTPRSGFLGRLDEVMGGFGVAPPRPTPTMPRPVPAPSPVQPAPVPQPMGRLQRRLSSFGGRGFLTNQGVY